MSDLLSVLPAMAAGKGRIVPDDILFLRKHLFPHGLTSADDAAALLAIHRNCPDKCAEWDIWFVELLTAFAVFHSWPQNSLDDINADWIVGLIAEDGVVESEAELALLLHVIEVSRHVPEQLTALAIQQLHIAIAAGKGAYAATRSGKRRGIGRDDIILLYRVLNGSAHAGKMLLGAREIDALMVLDLAVRGCGNHPAWSDLVSSITPRRSRQAAYAGRWLRMLEADILDGEEEAA